MGIQTSGQGTGAGSGAVRCPDCGGLNPAGAEWCGQCLRSFVAPAPPSPPPPPSVTALEPSPIQQDIDDYFSDISDPLADPPAPPWDQTATADLIDSLGAGTMVDPLGVDPLDIEQPIDRVEMEAHLAPVVPLIPHESPAAPSPHSATWTCRLCETPNDLTADTCQVCGSTFAETMRPTGPQVSGDPNQAALYSLFFPGAGHAYLGLWGQAIARAIMSAWVLLATAFLFFGAGGGGSKFFAIFFALSATALWVVAAHDAFREASGEQSLVILQGRRYLYVTGTLVGGLSLMLLAGAATAAA